ncbi:MAG TPA: ion transporter [Tepidiformaceae bacterium]
MVQERTASGRAGVPPEEINPEDERRWRVQELATSAFDIALAVLAVISLLLLIVEFTRETTDAWARRAVTIQTVIWAIFLATFLVELSLAPSKRRYLRKNWLVAVSVAIPALRVFRVVQAVRVLRGARALRGLNAARSLTVLNRARRAMGSYLAENRFGYLAVLAVVVTVTSAAAVYYLERGHSGANITSFGDAIWWAATIITTVNSPLEPVTYEARVLALMLRIFGLAVIGYITATLAVFLLGGTGKKELDRVQAEELRALREQVEKLTEILEQQGTATTGEIGAEGVDRR